MCFLLGAGLLHGHAHGHRKLGVKVRVDAAEVIGGCASGIAPHSTHAPTAAAKRTFADDRRGHEHIGWDAAWRDAHKVAGHQPTSAEAAFDRKNTGHESVSTRQLKAGACRATLLVPNENPWLILPIVVLVHRFDESLKFFLVVLDFSNAYDVDSNL